MSNRPWTRMPGTLGGWTMADSAPRARTRFAAVSTALARCEASFSSRVKVSDEDEYPPNLKTDAKNLTVLTARRVDGGKLTSPKGGSLADVKRGCRVVPVIRTAGGAWIRFEARTLKPMKLDAAALLAADDARGFNEAVKKASAQKTCGSTILLAPWPSELMAQRFWTHPRSASQHVRWL